MSMNTQGALPKNCSVDGDCPASLVCYDAHVAWTQNQSYCLCSTWYGWTLSSTIPNVCEITGWTISSIVFFALCAAIIIYRTGILFFTVYTAWQLGRLTKDSSFALAFLMCFGWLMTGLLRTIFASIEFARPNDQNIMPFGPTWKYSPWGVYQTKPLFAASTVFGMLTDYQLIIVWLAVSLGSSKYMRSRKRIITIVTGVVWIIELSYIIGASLLIVQDQVSRFLYFSVAYFILALIGYASVGGFLYRLLINAVQAQTARTNNHMMNVAHRIRLTAVANAVLILFNIVCMVGLGETNPRFKVLGFLPAGFHNAQIAVMTCQLVVITFYFFLTIVSRNRYEKGLMTTSKLVGPVAGNHNDVANGGANAARPSKMSPDKTTAYKTVAIDLRLPPRPQTPVEHIKSDQATTREFGDEKEVVTRDTSKETDEPQADVKSPGGNVDIHFYSGDAATSNFPSSSEEARKFSTGSSPYPAPSPGGPLRKATASQRQAREEDRDDSDSFEIRPCPGRESPRQFSRTSLERLKKLTNPAPPPTANELDEFMLEDAHDVTPESEHLTARPPEMPVSSTSTGVHRSDDSTEAFNVAFLPHPDSTQPSPSTVAEKPQTNTKSSFTSRNVVFVDQPISPDRKLQKKVTAALPNTPTDALAGQAVSSSVGGSSRARASVKGRKKIGFEEVFYG